MSNQEILKEISNIYNSIKLSELSNRLNLNEEETEKFVLNEIISGKLKGTIDQVKGIIYFEGHHEIDEWSNKIERVLTLIENTANLILEKYPEINDNDKK